MKKNHADFFVQKKSWSFFKDDILHRYLPGYFQKILTTNKPVIYIDGFAGKGMFDDGNPGSPIIALDAIDAALCNTKAVDPRITSYFIESTFYSDLTENIGGRSNVNIYNGRYQDNIEIIFKQVGNGNLFMYLDPFGVTDLNMGQFENLVTSDCHSVEFLLNFHSHGFFRIACSALDIFYDEGDSEDIDECEVILYFPKDKKVNTLNVIAGGDYWMQIVLDYRNGQIDGKEAERRITRQYCEKLRRSFEYVLEMPICSSLGSKPKYRMIFATKKSPGYYLMAECMFKSIERIKLTHSKGQTTFLTETIENEPYDVNEEKQYLLSVIPKFPPERITDIFVKYYQDRGLRCCPSELRKFISDFEKDGCLLVDRIPRLGKSGKPSRFLTETNRQLVKIHKI